MTNKWAEMSDEEYKKQLAEGKEQRYHHFVQDLLTRARVICPSVTLTQVAIAYRLNYVIKSMFEWKEASEFFERFDAEPEE
jgi:hypothetical protein